MSRLNEHYREITKVRARMQNHFRDEHPGWHIFQVILNPFLVHPHTNFRATNTQCKTTTNMYR